MTRPLVDGAVYLDTSAWVKLYINEAESDAVAAWLSAAATRYTVLIAWAEMRAALARAERAGRFAAAFNKTALASAERDWADFVVVQPTEVIVRRAGDLADRFGLRGYDSVHLAAAEAISLLLMPEPLAFVCFDERLCDAAGALGMGTVG